MAIISLLGAVVLIVLVLWEAIAPNERVTRVLTDQVGDTFTCYVLIVRFLVV